MLLFVAVFGVMAALLAGYAWLAVRARRHGGGHSFMGPFEDMWDPAAHRSDVTVQEQVRRKAPAPAPGDPPEAGHAPPDPR